MRSKFTKFKKVIFAIVIIVSLITITYSSYYIFVVLEEQEPITIIGDLGFQNYDFEGDGSLSNPYIIELCSIRLPENAQFGEYYVAITIQYVSKCFIIRNNYIHLGNRGYGIYLDQISGNFTIENNKIIGSDQYSSRVALSLINIASDYGKISNNEIINNHGFFFEDCINLQIINNTFKSIYEPMIRFCFDCTFYGNLILDSGQFMHVYQCPEMNISYNIFKNTPGTYRYFSYRYRSLYINSPNTTISNNIFELTGLELDGEYSNSYLIDNNIVNGKPLGYFTNQTGLNLSIPNQYGQLFMVNCNFSSIEYQTIQDTTCPIKIVKSVNCTVYNCTLSYYLFASMIKNSVNITYSQCKIEEGETGLYIWESTINLINKIFQKLDDFIMIIRSILYLKDNIFIF
ncbi:MAG: hypothetical protein ACFFKA_09165 [Candidatus Thorarchaeota archaeon]